MVWSCTKDDSTEISVLNFEGIGASYLAGPTSYGENLYSYFGEGQITNYYDQTTGLSFGLTAAPPFGDITAAPVYDFYNGGIVASQWHDMTTAGYLNQCSVYYTDKATQMGGHNGSATFGVVYSATALKFDLKRAAVIESLYVNNSTYAALSMKKGDDYSMKHHYGNKAWFKVIFTGVDAADVETGKVECYLSDFREMYSPGLLNKWTKVDLSVLGVVQQVKISFEGSDVGDWGLNTPAYVCIDDITVVR